jgi:hypothetical protein
MKIIPSKEAGDPVVDSLAEIARDKCYRELAARWFHGSCLDKGEVRFPEKRTAGLRVGTAVGSRRSK